MHILIRPHGELWSYEVHGGESSPLRRRLLDYLASEGLQFLSPAGPEQPFHVGPLHPEQAYAFERDWWTYMAEDGCAPGQSP